LIRQDLAATPGEIRYVSIGAMAGPTIELPSAALRGARFHLLGSGTGNFPPAPQMATFVSDVLKYAAAGKLPLDIVVRPLADVQAVLGEPPDAEQRLVFAIT
jgi:hypothetical protein